jgi:hypothetical protein
MYQLPQLTCGWCRGCASVPVIRAAQQHRTWSTRYQTNPPWWCKEVAPHSWHMSIQSLRHIIKGNTSTSHLLFSYKRDTQFKTYIKGDYKVPGSIFYITIFMRKFYTAKWLNEIVRDKLGKKRKLPLLLTPLKIISVSFCNIKQVRKLCTA